MALDADAWRTLVLKACEGSTLVADSWEELWGRRAALDEADPTGELRFRQLVVDGLEIVMQNAPSNVSTSEGGGQHIDAQQYPANLKVLYDMALAALNRQLKDLNLAAYLGVDLAIKPMLTTSLTPADPGRLDPGSPGYMGDPRYWRGGSVRW